MDAAAAAVAAGRPPPPPELLTEAVPLEEKLWLYGRRVLRLAATLGREHTVRGGDPPHAIMPV